MRIFKANTVATGRRKKCSILASWELRKQLQMTRLCLVLFRILQNISNHRKSRFISQHHSMETFISSRLDNYETSDIESDCLFLNWSKTRFLSSASLYILYFDLTLRRQVSDNCGIFCLSIDLLPALWVSRDSTRWLAQYRLPPGNKTFVDLWRQCLTESGRSLSN